MLGYNGTNTYIKGQTMPEEASTPSKRGRPRKYATGRANVAARLVPERYAAVLKAAQDNKRSISEEIEHRIDQSFRTDAAWKLRNEHDKRTNEHIKQLYAHEHVLRAHIETLGQERHGLLQQIDGHLRQIFDLQHECRDLRQERRLSEEMVERAVERAVERVFGRMIPTENPDTTKRLAQVPNPPKDAGKGEGESDGDTRFDALLVDLFNDGGIPELERELDRRAILRERRELKRRGFSTGPFFDEDHPLPNVDANPGFDARLVELFNRHSIPESERALDRLAILYGLCGRVPKKLKGKRDEEREARRSITAKDTE